MAQVRSDYPSDLTDEQWKLIREFIPPARTGGRPRSTDVRRIVCGIFYVNCTGCAWRYLPKDFPPWRTVYEYFVNWKLSGVLEALHAGLRNQVRELYKKDPAPSVLIADSQSVRAPRGEDRGFDGYKRVQGRKRQILVDTLGLVHRVFVHSAQLQDRKEAVNLLNGYPRGKLKMIYADRGYTGYFCDQSFARLGIWPTITSLKPGGHGNEFIPPSKQPKRWIVERTFAWMNAYRRLAKDQERKCSSSEGMVYWAMTQLMLRRLRPLRLTQYH